MTLDFEVFDDEGCFIYSDDQFDSLVDALDDALKNRERGEIGDTEYVRILEGLISDEPNFIDGHAHLGYALHDQDKPKKALQACLEGIRVGEAVIPEDFKGQLKWGVHENRPFLRAIRGAVLCYLRLRKRKDAIILMEKSLFYNPNDNQGIRFLLAPEYLRAGSKRKARTLLEKEIGGFPIYPPFYYELALLNLLEGEWTDAATHLRRGFLANFYIAEMLTGNIRPTPLAIWHGSNHSEPELAVLYASKYSDFWFRNPEFTAFVRWLFNHPKVLMERAAYLECQEELRWVHDFERRGVVLERMRTFASEVDSQLSQEIFQPRQDRHGNTVLPWLLNLEERW